jgi:UDP-2,3-diacylglucosamine pyrophosphatase LpxH
MLKNWLRKKISNLSNKKSSNPNKVVIAQKLDGLLKQIVAGNSKLGLHVSDLSNKKFIVLSDQHRGDGSQADDMNASKDTYTRALKYYFENGYILIVLGDSEEFWKFSPKKIYEKYKEQLELEKQFVANNRYYKIIGNHDSDWISNFLMGGWHKKYFGTKINLYDGLVLTAGDKNILLVHGHQGDKQSDGNKFSRWFVAHVWVHVQRWLQLNLNTPSNNADMYNAQNAAYYNWVAAKKNLLLVAGHTHKSVFKSYNHIEKLLFDIENAKRNGNMDLLSQLKENLEKTQNKTEYKDIKVDMTPKKPYYFNTGCCCYDNGSITGIEINETQIQLIRWKQQGDEEVRETALIKDLK